MDYNTQHGPPPGAAIFKQLASSKAFMYAAAFATGALFFNFLTTFAMGGGGSLFAVPILIGHIPAALICAGMWLTCEAGRTGGPPVKTTGLSILRGVSIYFMAVGGILGLMCVYLLLAMRADGAVIDTIISMVPEMAGVFEPLSPEELLAAFSVALVILAAAAALFVVYCVLMSKALRSIRLSLAAGQPAQIPAYIIVVNIIMAAFAGLGLLTSLAGAPWTTVLASLCDIAALIALTSVLVKYRGAVRALTPQPGGYGGPPVSGAAPVTPPPPPGPPPQPREFVFCDICFKQSGKEDNACMHCGAPLPQAKPKE